LVSISVHLDWVVRRAWRCRRQQSSWYRARFVLPDRGSCGRVNRGREIWCDTCADKVSGLVVMALGEWQCDFEAGVSRTRFNGEASVMFENDDVVGDMQTQARAESDGLGRKERVKNARLNIGRNARTRIANLNTHVVGFAVGAERKFAFAFHRVNRIVNDIRPDLIQIAGVRFNLGEVALIVAIDGDALLPFTP